MKEKQATIYQCEYCKKWYQKKHACIKHEKFCSKNPKNQHACFDMCPYLEKTYEDADVEIGDGYTRKVTVFICKITNALMYSYIAERRNLPCINDSDHIRMPLKCDNFEFLS